MHFDGQKKRITFLYTFAYYYITKNAVVNSVFKKI